MRAKVAIIYSMLENKTRYCRYASRCTSK